MPAKFNFANYIVRVYRFEKNKPGGLVGVVEEAGLKGKKAFTNLSELWDILSSCQDIKNQRKNFSEKNTIGEVLKDGKKRSPKSAHKKGSRRI